MNETKKLNLKVNMYENITSWFFASVKPFIGFKMRLLCDYKFFLHLTPVFEISILLQWTDSGDVESYYMLTESTRNKPPH